MFPNKPFIVAELGASHHGEYSQAFQLIDAAKSAGADAVKFQTYVPSEIAADVMIQAGPWAGRSYRDLYREGKTPWEWHDALFTYARGLGLIPFSSPFSEFAVELLESINCPMYKIASPEIVHLPLIRAAARTGKPLIISTGMASEYEIYMANWAAQEAGAEDITFLHCVSAYPAQPKDFNLCTLQRMRDMGLKVGLSDHSPGYGCGVATMAVALGAEVIEKHLTLSRNGGGPDDKFALEPGEFVDLVANCRLAFQALGTEPFKRGEDEQVSKQYRRSIWVTKDVAKGELLTSENLGILRPSYGAAPRYWDSIVGKRANRYISANTPMKLDFVDGLRPEF